MNCINVRLPGSRGKPPVVWVPARKPWPASRPHHGLRTATPACSHLTQESGQALLHNLQLLQDARQRILKDVRGAAGADAGAALLHVSNQLRGGRPRRACRAPSACTCSDSNLPKPTHMHQRDVAPLPAPTARRAPTHLFVVLVNRSKAPGLLGQLPHDVPRAEEGNGGRGGAGMASLATDGLARPGNGAREQASSTSPSCPIACRPLETETLPPSPPALPRRAARHGGVLA